jgi:hemerythrin
VSKPLYIVWQDAFMQGESIIDEQHRGVLATVNSLHYFLQQGQGLEALMPTVKILVSYLMFHFKTEEGILRATEYPDIARYNRYANESVDEFKRICRQSITYKDPEEVLLFLKNWWYRHLEMHEQITPYLHNWRGEYCRVDQH